MTLYRFPVASNNKPFFEQIDVSSTGISFYNETHQVQFTVLNLYIYEHKGTHNVSLVFNEDLTPFYNREPMYHKNNIDELKTNPEFKIFKLPDNEMGFDCIVIRTDTAQDTFWLHSGKTFNYVMINPEAIRLKDYSHSVRIP